MDVIRRVGPIALVGFGLALAAPARAEVPHGDLAPLVARLLPAVVNISSDTMADKNSGDRKRESLGSGFIISPDGLVITNNHVINGAYEITVTLQDHTALKATVVGASKIADLAVLRVHFGRPLPVVKFGDDTKLRPGEQVIAIGNPLGLGGSVSSGIVSALNRNIDLSVYDDFIQTDAAINHGNSGGPLFNMAGEVVGVNTAIISPQQQGGSVGLGFSLPASSVVFCTDSLIRYGYIRSAWLGVTAQDVTTDIAEALSLPQVTGAIITDVLAGHSAAEAGLKSGDVILGVNGQPVTDTRALRRLFAVLPIGSTGELQVLREGRDAVVLAKAEQWFPPPGTEDNSAGVGIQPAHVETANLGMTMEPLTDYARGEYHLKPEQVGVLVSEVAERSIADDHGIVKGDVITRVQDTPVSLPDEVMAFLNGMREVNRRNILVLVQGKDGLRWVSLPLRLSATAGVAPDTAPSRGSGGPAPASATVTGK